MTHPRIPLSNLLKIKQISPLPTSITVFIGYTSPTRTKTFGVPVQVRNFAEYKQAFGVPTSPSAVDSDCGYAVQPFFAIAPSPAATYVIGLSNRTSTVNPRDFDAIFADRSPLDQLGQFNLLVMPGVTDAHVVDTALAFVEKKHAFLLLDPPRAVASGQASVQDILAWARTRALPNTPNGAIYYPYVDVSDPITKTSISVPPSAFAAATIAHVDAERGMWKSPTSIPLANTQIPQSLRVTDQQQDLLTPARINPIRTFPGRGTLVWGARTLLAQGTGDPAYLYISARRTILWIEASVAQGLSWTRFEPNAEPLWATIRSTVTRFLTTVFQAGAFPGSTPQTAFFVRCDRTTMTQTDIDNGVINIMIGLALLKPAEFTIVRIRQAALGFRSGS